GRGNGGDEPVNAGHGRRLADEDGRPLRSLDAALKRQVLELEFPLFRYFLEDRLDLGQLAGLGDVIERSEPHGTDRRIGAGVPGHDDRLGIGRDLLEVLEHFDAIHAGHAQVENGRVVTALLQRLEGGATVGADRDLVPQPGQFRAHELLQGLFVIDEQHPQGFVRRRGQAFPPLGAVRSSESRGRHQDSVLTPISPRSYSGTRARPLHERPGPARAPFCPTAPPPRVPTIFPYYFPLRLSIPWFFPPSRPPPLPPVRGGAAPRTCSLCGARRW